MFLSLPTAPQSLSSLKSLSPDSLSLTTHLSLTTPPLKPSPIRMGGGPRTYPGGVSKWQWKRMQAKKAQQLLKARLARERQIYEMRKRAELKAAVSELERPWEAVEKPPTLFSVSADEQLKVLADRFQKPGGLDLWSERDGPELFRNDNGLPSARFFPKGVVHSVKPYGKVGEVGGGEFEEGVEGFGSEEDLSLLSGSGLMGTSVGKLDVGRKGGLYGNSRSGRSLGSGSEEDSGLGSVGKSVGRLGGGRKGNYRNSRSGRGSGAVEGSESGNFKGKIGKSRSGIRYLSDSGGRNSGDGGFDNGNDGELRMRNRHEKSEKRNSEVFDMNLQNDGSYGLESGK